LLTLSTEFISLGNRTALEIASLGVGSLSLPEPFSSPEEPIELLRLFLFSTDADYDVDDAFQALCTLGKGSPSTGDKVLVPAFAWMIKALGSELRDSNSQDTVYSILSSAINTRSPPMLTMALDISGDKIDATSYLGGWSAIFQAIYRCNFDACRVLTQRRANLHLEGLSHLKSPVIETPTSLALYSSTAFFSWREVLRECGIDFAEFVREELQRAPLRDDGWDEHALLKIF
jgi:hypothetical protein